MKYEHFREKIILDIFNQFKPCYRRVEDDSSVQLIDPIENKVIGFHYGETHMAVAFIIYGHVNKDNEIYKTGIGILKYFIEHLDEFQRIDSYHWDFNNLALCILIEFLETNSICDFPLKVEKLKKLVISQQDSKHGTINWMPMRAYTNWCKFYWTGNKSYKDKYLEYLKNISDAEYNDGFYDDFLPKGKSFNFQYHIYTTAMLSMLSRRMDDVELPFNAIQRCVDIVDINGDINYLGRGCNQIFAWGPAMYLFYATGANQTLDCTLTYLEKNFPSALKRNNLIMADVPGEDRIWWWDYHYSTVYFGHMAFWMAMTYLDKPKQAGLKVSDQNLNGDSGVHIVRKGSNYCCIFMGRHHYLAENGPVVANVALDGIGTIFKGPLGPCGKLFGSKYARPVETVLNYLGPVKERLFFGKLVLIENVFPEKISCDFQDGSVELVYTLKKHTKNLRFSIPVMVSTEHINIEFYVDDQLQKVSYVGSYVGPYGKTERLESETFTGKVLKLCLRRR